MPHVDNLYNRLQSRSIYLITIKESVSPFENEINKIRGTVNNIVVTDIETT